MTKINLTEHLSTQDMIRIIMDEKGMSAKEAVAFSVNQKMYARIFETSWASIALNLWGHDDPDREWLTLDQPCLEIELDILSQDLVDEVVRKFKVNTETAVSYFLIFTMESMGYHI